jgi:hypothetical protein
MTDNPERQPDKDPAPVEHSDAERLSGGDGEGASESEDARADELEADPSQNPDDERLRDVKGG